MLTWLSCCHRYRYKIALKLMTSTLLSCWHLHTTLLLFARLICDKYWFSIHFFGLGNFLPHSVLFRSTKAMARYRSAVFLFHEVILSFKQHFCETWLSFRLLPPLTDLGEFWEWISVAEGACWHQMAWELWIHTQGSTKELKQTCSGHVERGKNK